MSIEQRLARMRALRQGIERSLLILPESEEDRRSQEIRAIDEHIFQDEVRLAKERGGIETEAETSYCPVIRRTRERNYCENTNGSGKACASFEKCYH